MTDSLQLQTWTDLWATTTDALGDSTEARHILEHASNQGAASWLILLQTAAPAGAAAKVNQMVKRRLAGEPLQYVLGHWGFRSLDLVVDNRVLIPRPETEEVVEAALRFIPEDRASGIIDLGTGSGAIALSVAQERAKAQLIATDESADALEVAKLNASSLDPAVADRVHFFHGSWFDALPAAVKGRIDLIISNPPYVTEEEKATLDASVLDWEPHIALFAGDDGLDDLRMITALAPSWLRRGGALIMEMAPSQTEPVIALALEAGFETAEFGRDITGRPRWVTAVMPA